MSLPVAARFRAIITGPLSGSPGTSDSQQSAYDAYGGVRFQDGPSTKRKKDGNDVGARNPKKVLRRTPEDDGGSTREPTVSFQDREELLKALQDRFKEGPHVDFHGMYEMLDPGSTHKMRTQSMAIEIWKATGYRFTCVFSVNPGLALKRGDRVKDHPQFTNGHKTRFWCSQDEAHRSKSSRAARKAQGDLYRPRQSSTGEALAKNRFPCRSRLLISSRDTNVPGRPIVTVRMHHHVAHEPYVDLNVPPAVAQGVCNNYWWISKLSAGVGTSTSGTNGTRNPPPVVQGDMEALPAEQTPPQQDLYNDLAHEIPDEMSPQLHPTPTIFTQNQQPRPPSSHSTMTPQTMAQDIAPTMPMQSGNIYHSRMLAHIRNIREFCDGLEFQLQFDDYRMLEVLEREGRQFLDFVADCLKKEGRLVTTDQAIVSSTPVHQVTTTTTTHMMNRLSPPHEPVMSSLQISPEYEGNPGINPSALAC